MLMRTDPFRELDRFMQQVAGTQSRPAPMPMDAYRNGDSFLVMFDLPGVSPESIDLTGHDLIHTLLLTEAEPEHH